jgi:dUTP pyrophosphatase
LNIWKDFYLNIELVDPNAKMPTRAYSGDAGLDVYATEDLIILPRGAVKIPLGFRVEFPEGFVMIVSDKSGISYHMRIENVGSVIDAGYRGIVHVCLESNNEETVIIKSGEKIAQLIVFPCWCGNPIQVDKVSNNVERGNRGFGSSGKK